MHESEQNEREVVSKFSRQAAELGVKWYGIERQK